MSAAELSLKEKMARLKAKKEADAAAKAGGAAVPAMSAAMHGARPASVGGAASVAGSAGRPAAASVAGRAAPLVGTPVPIKAPPRPGSNNSARPAAPAATSAPPSRPASQTARPPPTAAAAASPSIVAPVAATAMATATAAAAVPKRRIQKKVVQPGDAAAASAGAAAPTAATPAPSLSTAAPPAASSTSAPSAGVKRKKHSAPAPIVQLVTNAEAEAHAKKPRVSLANTDHLGGYSRENLRNNHEAGLRRPTAEEKCTLWIENLAEGVTGDDLRPLLSPFGHIEELKIGPGKSYGTIRFRTRDAASMVIEVAHDSMLAGAAVQISWYLPRERGSLPPAAPASTAQPDLDRYHEFGAAPTNFAALLRDYKPLVAARPRLVPDSARHGRVPPSTTLGDVGVLTRRAARAHADATPLPQLPTDVPPRELVPYAMLEY